MPSQETTRLIGILEQMRMNGVDTDRRTAHIWKDLNELSSFIGEFLNATAMDRKATALATMRIEEAVRRVEDAATRIENGVTECGGDTSKLLDLAKETVRYAQKIPRVLQTAEATLLAADAAAEGVSKMSRLTQTTLDLMNDLRRQEVGEGDVVSEEPVRSNVIPFRPVPERSTFDLPRNTRITGRRSLPAMAAMIVMTFATAALSMSGSPYDGNAKMPHEDDLGAISQVETPSPAPETPKPATHKAKKHKKH